MNLQTLGKALDVPEDKPIWKWCEDNLVISPRQPSPWHGRYSTSNTPWVRGIMAALQDPGVWMVVVRKGTQSAGTQTGFSWHCYTIANDPGPILVVFPAEDEAKSASEMRFMPLIEDSPIMTQELTGKRDDFKKMEYRFRKTIMRWIGSNSASKLASRAIRYLHITEIDKFKDTIGKEGSVADLAIQRTKRFWNRKVYIESSPTTQDGYVTRYFGKGDQRQYFIKCLKCKKEMVLKFKTHVRFEFTPGLKDPLVWYECEHCKYKFGDDEKKNMVELGEWRGTVDAREKGVASFDLGGLIPTLPGNELPSLVNKFLSVKGNADELQSFLNSDLGEVWEERPKFEIHRKSIWQFRDMHKYRRGTIPLKGWFSLWLTVDVQEYYVPTNIWAHGPKDMALVDHGRVDMLTDLDSFYDKKFVTDDGRECVIDGIIIDTGFKTEQVYDFVRRVQQRNIFCVPVKGEKGLITSSVELIKINELQSSPGIHLAHIHPTKWHDMVGDTLRKLVAEEGQTLDQAWNARPFRLHFHEDIDKDYVDQITAEVLMEDEPNKQGLRQRYWKKIRKDNHEFDMFRYALVTRYLLRDDFAKVLAEAELQTKDGQPATGWNVVDRRTKLQ
jgi:phage terminase large subunit GpA-like protein